MYIYRFSFIENEFSPLQGMRQVSMWIYTVLQCLVFDCIVWCIYTCLYISGYVYIYTCMYIYIHAYVYTCTYICICMYMHTHTHMYIYMCTYTYIYINTHIIDWFWKSGWLIHKSALCTGIAPLPQWGQNAYNISTNSQLVRKIGSQNQSIVAAVQDLRARHMCVSQEKFPRHNFTHQSTYGVATISRLLKMIGPFCKI